MSQSLKELRTEISNIKKQMKSFEKVLEKKAKYTVEDALNRRTATEQHLLLSIKLSGLEAQLNDNSKSIKQILLNNVSNIIKKLWK